MTTISRSLTALVISCLMLVTACAPSAPAPKHYMPSFADKPAYVLNAGRIDVVEEYQSSFKFPNAEHLFAVTPAEGAKIWVKDRLHASSGENVAEFVIKDASVIETALNRTKGIEGAFTKDQSQQFDGKLSVELKIFEPGKMIPAANVNVNVAKTMTLREDASPVDREKLFNQMTDELLAMLNSQLEKQISSYFNNYLLP